MHALVLVNINLMQTKFEVPWFTNFQRYDWNPCNFEMCHVTLTKLI